MGTEDYCLFAFNDLAKYDWPTDTILNTMNLAANAESWKMFQVENTKHVLVGSFNLSECYLVDVVNFVL